jgi:hypothetical protein
MPLETTDIFRSFGGLWTYQRRISGYRAGQPMAYAEGEVRMLPQGSATWLYEETGRVIVAGVAHLGRQKYRYLRDAQTGAIRVVFGQGERDGRHFHDLAFDADTGPVRHAYGQHPCGHDLYGVDYLFYVSAKQLDAWLITYRVRGPQKHYVSRTFLRRAMVNKNCSQHLLT